MRMPLGTEKMQGPTFNLLSDAHLEERESLIWKVATCSPSQLSALVIGPSVYEVFMDLRECEHLITSMTYVKQKQLKFPPAAGVRWIYNEMRKRKDGKDLLINKRVMLPFLTRYPITILCNSVFKPFLTVAKRFLLSKLYQFTNGRALYDSIPNLLSEKQLPAVVNALGPMEQLSANYPHLAQMKEEMVCNIMDFILKYCLDWICEVSTLKCDSNGKISYFLRPLALVQYQQKEKGVASKSRKKNRKQFAASNEDKADVKCKTDDDTWKPQTQNLNSSTKNFSNQDVKKELVAEAAKIEVIELKEEEESVKPSTSNAPVIVPPTTGQPGEIMQTTPQAPSQQCLQSEVVHSLSTPAYSVIHDDWSDMLTMALTDPNLAPHYKTMIHCLVASNRDMKNIIVMMKSGQS